MSHNVKKRSDDVGHFSMNVMIEVVGFHDHDSGEGYLEAACSVAMATVCCGCRPFASSSGDTGGVSFVSDDCRCSSSSRHVDLADLDHSGSCLGASSSESSSSS